MLAALASADTLTWVSILVKALAYAATLSAVGAVLVLACLRELSDSGRASLRRTAVLAAVAAAVFTVLRLPIRASFLMGGTLNGAMDPMMLGMVSESPLGTSVAVRLAGLGLILCVIWRVRLGLWLALSGAVLSSASFALRGHALGEPQMILGALITLHILCLAFWIGAFAPLVRSARSDPPARAGGFGTCVRPSGTLGGRPTYPCRRPNPRASRRGDASSLVEPPRANVRDQAHPLHRDPVLGCRQQTVPHTGASVVNARRKRAPTPIYWG